MTHLQSALSEDEKVEWLIAAVSRLKRAAFLRNGRVFGGEDAVAHLRTKWARSKAEIKTAEDFIRIVGARSLISGEPYRIRLPEGREVTPEAWFREQLLKIESVGKQ